MLYGGCGLISRRDRPPISMVDAANALCISFDLIRLPLVPEFEEGERSRLDQSCEVGLWEGVLELEFVKVSME